jgi:hypothetical protein
MLTSMARDRVVRTPSPEPGGLMNESERKETEQVPLGQRLFERPFLLLIAGIVVMLAFYTLWGLVEILTLRPAPLP